jgi:hypothetical protein
LAVGLALTGVAGQKGSNLVLATVKVFSGVTDAVARLLA